MIKREEGNIKTELISGIFLLSFLAIFITFFATFKISEKRQIELETIYLQKIFYDIEKQQPERVEQVLLFLPFGVSYGLYDPITKQLISGVDLLSKEKIKLGSSNTEIGNELFFPSITLYQSVIISGKPLFLVIKRDFDAEKGMIKKDVLIFMPFALVCLLTLTAFSYLLYRKRLLKPFELLKDAHSKVGVGNFKTKLSPVGIEEWDVLYSQFNQMMDYLENYKKDLEKTIEKLSETNKALKNAQEEIVFSEKMATVGRLAAGLAHEIGNPLTSIMGYLSFMVSNAKDEDEKNMLTLILSETERINRIIRDLLNFARNRSDDVLETCNPKDVVDETIRLLTPQKDFKKIKLVNNFNESMPVNFSAESLKQVLLNLIINAIDVTSEGGNITVSSRKDNGMLVLSIEDEGGGVPEEIKDKIFEPFFTTKPPGRGTGLGLSVVHTLVERYGGRVEFENTSKGAVFKVYIKGLEEYIG